MCLFDFIMEMRLDSLHLAQKEWQDSLFLLISARVSIEIWNQAMHTIASCSKATTFAPLNENL